MVSCSNRGGNSNSKVVTARGLTHFSPPTPDIDALPLSIN